MRESRARSRHPRRRTRDAGIRGPSPWTCSSRAAVSLCICMIISPLTFDVVRVVRVLGRDQATTHHRDSLKTIRSTRAVRRCHKRMGIAARKRQWHLSAQKSLQRKNRRSGSHGVGTSGKSALKNPRHGLVQEDRTGGRGGASRGREEEGDLEKMTKVQRSKLGGSRRTEEPSASALKLRVQNPLASARLEARFSRFFMPGIYLPSPASSLPILIPSQLTHFLPDSLYSRCVATAGERRSRAATTESRPALIGPAPKTTRCF